MAKQTLKDLRAIAKGHKINFYYKINNALRYYVIWVKKYPTMNQRLRNVLMAGKNMCVKNVTGMEYVNTTGRRRIVKSVEVHKYVNITSRSMVVKFVGASIYNK